MEVNFYKNYHITEEGDLYNTNTGKKLKYNKVRGYARYTLYHKGRNHWQAHRLVSTVYLPNPENKPCVNHKDGNKLNNHVSNLEWCTYSENELHSYKVLGKTNSQLGENSHKSKLTVETVLEIRDLPDRKEQTLRDAALKYDVSYWTIRDAAFFRNWNHI
jgi:hypothetical protein